MIKEKRTLPIGIEYKGKRHRELEIEPRRVSHMIDALDDARAQENSRYAEICTLACQITRLGDIPKEDITGDLLLPMYQQDYAMLSEAADTAQKRVERFRSDTENEEAAEKADSQGEAKASATGGAGHAEARLPVRGNQIDA